MDRRTLLKTLTFSVPMLAGLSVLADEQGGEGALTSELGKLLIESDYEKWLTIPGSNGQSFKVLPLKDKFKEMSTDVSAALVRLEEGYVIPPHMHPAGEFTYVLAGELVQDTDKEPSLQKTYQKGDFLWMPAGSVHGVATSKGVTVLSMKPAKTIPL